MMAKRDKIPVHNVQMLASKKMTDTVKSSLSGKLQDARDTYANAAPEGKRASDCIACGQCESPAFFAKPWFFFDLYHFEGLAAPALD